MFKSRGTGELVVKPRYSSRVKLFITGLIVVVGLGTGGLIYNHGLSMAGFERLSASRHQQDLRIAITRLEAENRASRESLARAERTLQIDQTTYQELDSALKASAQEIVKLREELNFYRNIISPPNKQSGLRIQSLKVESDRRDKEKIRYKMILIQALKHDQSVKGKARFEISGQQGGEKIVFKFPRPTDKPIRFSFKYFQDIEGEFKLPLGFKPQWIKANVTSRGRNAQKVEQTYPWPQA